MISKRAALTVRERNEDLKELVVIIRSYRLIKILERDQLIKHGLSILLIQRFSVITMFKKR